MHCWWETAWRFLKKLKIELPCVHAKSLQLCSTLWDPMDWSLPGSSVHGILQARMQEWVAISCTRGSFWPLNRAHVSCHLHWHQGSLAPGKPRTTIWLSNSTLHIYGKKKNPQSTNSETHMHPILTVALFTIVKIWKQLTCPSTDEWIKKMWHIYTQWNTSQPVKEWNFAICSNMNELGGHDAKWDKSERDKYYTLLLLLSCFSRVQLLVTPWTAAYQAPLSMGFSRQEYWSGVPLPSPKYHMASLIWGN